MHKSLFVAQVMDCDISIAIEKVHDLRLSINIQATRAYCNEENWSS
jgi:hypothetical protein